MNTLHIAETISFNLRKL